MSRSAAAGAVCAVVLVVAVTLVLEPLSELDPGISSGVLYVLAVLFVASQWGLRLGLATSALSGLGLAYYRAGPTHSFRADTGDVVAVGILLVTSAVVPWMTTVSPGWTAPALEVALREILELLVVLTFTVLPSASVT